MTQTENKLRIPETLRKVKNIVGVFSAKGGVGKSAISLQIALALKDKGLKVGLVDADIYGPSQPVMLNSAPGELKLTQDKVIEPLMKDGIKFISMGLISNEKMPVIWRGPMVSGAVMQLLSQTEWGELDYLIVDTPPGTGDVQISMSQKLKLNGTVIITTPQLLSLKDVVRGINMFIKVGVPILGVVENMSYLEEGNERNYIFGESKTKSLLLKENVNLLEELPFNTKVPKSCDDGKPYCFDFKDDYVSKFTNITNQIIKKLQN